MNRSALHQLETAELVHPFGAEEQAYIFKHALVQDAAYQMLLVKQRRELHRQVAHTLESMYADCLDDYAGLLARHYADAGDDTKTSQYALRAGELAMGHYAFPEARSHFSAAVNALARLPDTPAHRRNRVHALIRLVHASAFADDPAHNLARLEEAEQLAQSLSAIDLTAREQLAQVYYWHGFFRLLSNDMRSTIRYYRQAYALAQQISDDQLTAQLALEFAIVLNVQGRFGEAEPLIAQSIALMRRAGKPLEDVIALAHWGIALAGRGDYAEGLKQASQSLARVQEINSVYGIEFNLVLLAWIHFLGGEMLPALQAAQQAVNLARTAGDWIHVFTGSVFVAWALSRMGQHSAAQDTVAQIQTLIEKTHGHLVGMQMFMAVHSEIALNANQIDEALRLAQSAVAAAQANDVVFAEGIAERVWAQGLQQQNAAWNEIEAHLAQSLAAFEKGAVKIEMARTHKLWGQLLQSRGDTNAGRQHLEQAAQQFQPAGLAMELAQVQDLMREAKRA